MLSLNYNKLTLCLKLFGVCVIDQNSDIFSKIFKIKPCIHNNFFHTITISTQIIIVFQTIDYTSPRGGVTVLTSPPTRGHGGQPTSRSASTLLVSSVKPTDSGKYACRPSNAEAASVTVHILDGERSTRDICKIFCKLNYLHSCERLRIFVISTKPF